jgi:hypothetical protein
MEIHEYMTAKGTFMLRMLRLSGQLTDTEIEDIRRATRSATRMAPIKLDNLVMREFVIGDVDAVFEAKLAPTLIEAIELVVEIIHNAGKAKRSEHTLSLLFSFERIGDGARNYTWWAVWVSGSSKVTTPLILMGL